MRASRPYGVVLIGTLLACARPPSFPPPPGGVQRVAVEQPANRTGEDLIVDGPGLLQRVLRQETASVPDILGEDLRAVLVEQGFRVTEPDADVPVLRTEIRRWQHYAADYKTVTVEVAAALVEPGSGRELWTASGADWVVPTNDAGSRHDASRAAARAVAEALLAGWLPAPR
jgi:hypothetical protein